MNPYMYEPGTDGTEETFDIIGPEGLMVSVGYWYAREEAEARAKLIVNALNAFVAPVPAA